MLRIWRPTDDIDVAYSRARDHTLIAGAAARALPALGDVVAAAAGRLAGRAAGGARAGRRRRPRSPSAGVDADADGSLEDETLVLGDARRADALLRFRGRAPTAAYASRPSGAQLGGVRETPPGETVGALLGGALARTSSSPSRAARCCSCSGSPSASGCTSRTC